MLWHWRMAAKARYIGRSQTIEEYEVAELVATLTIQSLLATAQRDRTFLSLEVDWKDGPANHAASTLHV